ncbi:2Fe-2S iron-sulfur cluster-binding protein [Streptomyces salyersiae]|uniref:2Fe-2S iron-sulfur cluster-binding protein n=1 Tax=Streptomyces salyersiae TaxID=3075530 RepID=A0ABU2RDW4_9ACTN|nr:2Fe-2S iron-sulfur cluster-binding protein [Streptomyces sp. DSM 41770]MDT0426109.1 2Fe-2S iron-sulfur cluster-binding protein [Streptomyces sp. DSM 41770]
MSNEENPEQRHGEPDPYGGWQPTPQGDGYDADATAFVHLDPDDLAGLGSDPLAAPGHGYVPPMILPLTPAAGLDPSATGSWVVQTQSQQERAAEAAEAAGASGTPEAVHWPDPNQQQPYGQQPYGQHYPQSYQDGSSGYGQTSSTTAQWNFADPLPPADRGEHATAPDHMDAEHTAPDHMDAEHTAPDHHVAPGHTAPGGPAGYPESAGHRESAGHVEPVGHTGQWTIPVADGDLPEESGEYAASTLASSWYTDTPPATLPGGAPAPWAEHLQGTQDFAGPGDGTPGEHAEPATPEEEPAGAFHEPVETLQEAAEALQETAVAPGAPDDAPRASELPGTPPSEPSAPVSEATHTAPEPHAVDPVDPTDAADATAADPTAGDPVAADPAADVTADPSTEPPEDGPADEPSDQAPDPLPEPATTPLPAEAAAPAEREADTEEPAARTPAPSEHAAVSYVLHVNGVDRPVADAWIGESLLYVLRERLGLAGAKDGCSQGECGACNVQVDGRLVASCLVPAATTAGSEVRTVEGLAVDGEPSDIQRALAACGAVQCGFCIPGMAMTVHDLLEGNHAPSALETRQALCGNLCRCSGYRGVLDAVREVVESRDAGEPDDDEPRIPHQAAPGAGSVQAHPHEGDAR